MSGESGKGVFRLHDVDPSRAICAELLIVTTSGQDPQARRGAAACLAAIAARDRPVLWVEGYDGAESLAAGPVNTTAAGALTEIVAEAWRGETLPSVRGRVCHLRCAPEEAVSELPKLLSELPAGTLCVAYLDAARYRAVLEHIGHLISHVVLVSELGAERSLVGLCVDELRASGFACRVWKHAGPSRLGSWFGCLGWGPSRDDLRQGSRLLRRLGLGCSGRNLLASESGQVMPATVGIVVVLAVLALILVAFGGSLTGKGRVQRAADLAAISAAASLRDDLPRRLSPPTVNGVPNPFHMPKAEYLGNAEEAAADAARQNGAEPWDVRVGFPDRISPAPLSAKVELAARSEVAIGDKRDLAPISAEATAAVKPRIPDPLGSQGIVAATGGGYSGVLEVRQGKGMRPDVAAAFDRMAVAALAAGHSLIVNSAFRSDEEQAELFAANPDPTWVAPPGTSLHRCGTELDLGPSSAYDWLAANASRYGFELRYSWEPWHLGYSAGPEPCSAAGDRVRVGGDQVGAGGDGMLAAGGIPAYVPERFEGMITDAAARWDIPAELIAAQIKAESDFDPQAVSHMGAQGIAQFMPETAKEYGLLNPFDPRAAIMAQAEMMSEMLERFGSIELALAAYNAGPGAVGECGCVPNYPETIAYVDKILSFVSGLGTGSVLTAAVMEVALVE